VKLGKNKKRPRKRNGLKIFGKKKAKRNFLRGGTTADFAAEKMDDSNVDEDKCFLLSLLPSFRLFNDERKFLARMEILKIMLVQQRICKLNFFF
jgi:hypothetical protein